MFDGRSGLGEVIVERDAKVFASVDGFITDEPIWSGTGPTRGA